MGQNTQEEEPIERETPAVGACRMCGREIAPLTLQCPACGEVIADADESVRLVPGWPRIGPVVPRYVAASIDNGIAMVLSILAAKVVEGDVPAIQVPLLVGVYLGYFVVF